MTCVSGEPRRHLVLEGDGDRRPRKGGRGLPLSDES
jgi:hypothetical protein